MQSLEDCKKVFNYLGLSQYESKVYYSLIMEGASEARKLSIKCAVPRTKIYLTLKKLKERGLVYELPETPHKYAPASPAEAFQRYLSLYKKETAEKVISLIECKDLIVQLEENHSESKLSVNPKKEEIWVLKKKTEILNKINEILLQANSNVKVVTTKAGLIFLDRIAGKLFDTLVEKGVNIEVLTPIKGDNSFIVRELNYICTLKHVEVKLPILFISIDSKLCLLIMLNLADFDLKMEENLGVLCNNAELCKLYLLLATQSFS